MKNVCKSLLIVLASTSFTAFAQETTPVSTPVDAELPVAEQPTINKPVLEEVIFTEDLAFEGARWGGKAAGYVCEAAVTQFVETPTEYSTLNVTWGTVVTDFTLDNGLLLATFSPDADTTCRYSAIMLADSNLKTIELVESRAFASVGEGSCAAGKVILDTALASNKYLWKESRKHLTILAPSLSSEAICGKDATAVGIDFVFTGKIN